MNTFFCILQMNQVLEFLLEGDSDVQAWKTFASYLRDLPLEEARRGYEILFERFPCSGDYVVQYLELEKKYNNHQMILDVLLLRLQQVDPSSISSILCKHRYMEILLSIF